MERKTSEEIKQSVEQLEDEKVYELLCEIYDK
jgi:hypothetical protein